MRRITIDLDDELTVGGNTYVRLIKSNTNSATQGKHWSKDEDIALKTMRAKGKSWAEIGNSLGRTSGACCQRFMVLEKESNK